MPSRRRCWRIVLLLLLFLLLLLRRLLLLFLPRFSTWYSLENTILHTPRVFDRQHHGFLFCRIFRLPYALFSNTAGVGRVSHTSLPSSRVRRHLYTPPFPRCRRHYRLSSPLSLAAASGPTNTKRRRKRPPHPIRKPIAKTITATRQRRRRRRKTTCLLLSFPFPLRQLSILPHRLRRPPPWQRFLLRLRFRFRRRCLGPPFFSLRRVACLRAGRRKEEKPGPRRVLGVRGPLRRGPFTPRLRVRRRRRRR